MDTLAHALWTNAVFYPKYKNQLKSRLWAVFFGVAPDLAAFTPVILYSLFRGFQRFMPEAYNSSALWPYWWARNSYNFTHSAVIFLGVFLLITVLRKGKPYWPMLGWLLHIAIDIPSHRGFYETPFLFPLSNYKFDHGISWGHPVFMLINYSAILILYILIGTIWKKKEKI